MFLESEFSQNIQSEIEFKEFDLENGLHVILHRDNTNPIVSVNIWYHAGSKDEDSGHTGFAHLFEHIMFQGSRNVGKAGHFSYIQNAGGTLNGTTNSDRTNYFETVPSNQFELVLWLESDRMMSLNVTQENFDNQREVVKEEKRQRYDNRPYGTWPIHIFNKMFPNHPYFMPPIGSMKDLNDASLEYAQSFYKRFYSPDNAVLVVSGDIEYDNAKQLVAKYFSGIKPAGNIRKIYPEPVYNRGEVIDTVYENVQLPAAYIAYKIPSLTSDEIYAFEILGDILGSGKSSRLYNDLVYTRKLLKSVNAGAWGLELNSMFIISATAIDPKMTMEDMEKITDLISSHIEVIKNTPVQDKELEKAKNSEESSAINRMQTTMGKADRLAEYWTYFKNASLINTGIDKYLSVTSQDIINAAKKYLSPENRVIIYYSKSPVDLPEKK